MSRALQNQDISELVQGSLEEEARFGQDFRKKPKPDAPEPQLGGGVARTWPRTIQVRDQRKALALASGVFTDLSSWLPLLCLARLSLSIGKKRTP